MALTWKTIQNLTGSSLKLAFGTRLSSFLTSDRVQPLEEYPEVEIVKNPPEWKYVECLLPKATIPEPPVKAEYPSGWRPPSIGLHNIDQFNYYVRRTCNHLLPVYLLTTFRGQRRITVVRHVSGDIWQLERELRDVVERERKGRLCATRVNEMSGQVHIHGDYVDLVKNYLLIKGY